ncbi:CHAT domain-containing protein [candidate division KSB1 bacterium]|nr:CHAT domain-containing protein [candidate division KSB1 bacterium]
MAKNKKHIRFFLLFSLICGSVCKTEAPKQPAAANQYKEYIAAVNLFDENKYDLALDKFKQMIQFHPEFDKPYSKIVELYKSIHSLDTGLEYFNRLLSEQKNNPYIYYAIGLIFKEKQNFQQARQNFCHSIDLAPNYPHSYMEFIDISSKIKDLDSAAMYLTDLNNTHPQSAGVLFGLGYIFQVKKQWQQGLEYYDQALALNVNLLEVYQNKCAIYYYTGQFNELLNTASRAAEKAQVQQDDDYRCKFLANTGLAYLHLSKFNNAAQYLNQALDLARQLGDKNREMRILGNLGVIYKDSQQHAKALTCFFDALKIAHAIPDSQCIGVFTRNVGSVYYQQSDYNQALLYYEKSLPVLLKNGDKNNEALVLWSIGGIYWNFGDYPKALDYYQKAYHLASEVGNNWGMERYLGTMGLTYCRMGRYEEALEKVEQSLMIAREIGEKTGQSLRLGDLADIFSDMGENSRAAEYYQKALDIATETGNKREQSKFLGKLGEIERKNKNYARALDHYNRAANLAQEIKNRNLQSELLGQIGNLHLSQHQYEKARINIEKGLEIASELKNKSLQARHLLFLAQAFYQTHDLVKSKQFYNQSLEITKKLAEPDVVWNALQGLAQVEAALGKNHRALRLYEKCIEKMDKVQNTLMTETFKIGFLETHIKIYENIIHLLSVMHNNQPGKGYDRLAFKYAEKAKARALLDIIHQGRIVNNLSDIPETFRKNLLTNQEKLKSRHISLSAELAKTEQEQDKILIDSLHNEIDFLTRMDRKLLTELEQKYTRYYHLTNPQVISPMELQENILDSSKILVEYFVGEERTFVWTITKTEMFFDTIPITRVALHGRLCNISPLFMEDKDSGAYIDHAFANLQPDSLFQFYSLLLKKYLEQHAGTIRELILVPDDILYYFPFEIMVLSNSPGSTRFLVEDYAVSYSSSASLLAVVTHHAVKKPLSLLAFGNPQFDRHFKIASMKRLFTDVAGRSIFRGHQFTPLPFSEHEVNSIGKNFSNPGLFTGAQATEANFLKFADQYDYIHLATHFVTNDRHPMYSKIIFAQNKDGSQDGLLHTYEVYNLKLDADMIVLSGCSSGLGKLRRGEGIVGMSRGFLYAGVPSMVVSLWPVEDKSTADLMSNFYRFLTSGVSKAQALQRAKINLIQKENFQRDPFYWGAFVLMGAWQ